VGQYRIILGAESPYISANSEETVNLEEYFGITDEEWDEMSEREQNRFVNEAAKDNFWNSGYGYWGKVEK
jgi:hypothetical protein